jgi:TfoX/Sxy family transcriptional regulator of competence genes
MAFDETLAERIRKALARKKGITEKKMFGGVGFLLNGNMCVGVWKESLIVRLDPEEFDDALKEAHVSEFNITGRSMKGWALVGPQGVATDTELKEWIGRAVKTLCLRNEGARNESDNPQAQRRTNRHCGR